LLLLLLLLLVSQPKRSGKMPKNSQPKPETPWKDSRAKKKLTKDILSGKVPPEWKPKQVFAMRPDLYKDYEKNFGSNLRRLQKCLKDQQDRADEDDAAVRHDLGLYPRSAAAAANGYPRWDGSAAQHLLRQDMKDGRHVLKAKALRETREEYMEFPLKVLNDHIHQEKRALLGKSYWLFRKKQNKAEQEDEDDSMM
jgi:hypothetical protein